MFVVFLKINVYVQWNCFNESENTFLYTIIKIKRHTLNPIHIPVCHQVHQPIIFALNQPFSIKQLIRET